MLVDQRLDLRIWREYALLLLCFPDMVRLFKSSVVSMLVVLRLLLSLSAAEEAWLVIQEVRRRNRVEDRVCLKLVLLLQILSPPITVHLHLHLSTH